MGPNSKTQRFNEECVLLQQEQCSTGKSISTSNHARKSNMKQGRWDNQGLSQKKTPVALPQQIWKPLKGYGLVRTPEEHWYYILHNAAVADHGDSQHAHEVKRLLTMGLALSPRMNGFNLVFKERSENGVDLLLEGQNFLIDGKFLDFKETHKSFPCDLSREGVVTNQNPCDHVIKHSSVSLLW